MSHFRSQKGQALIQALVALAVISAVMAASMITIEMQTREARFLSQKMESLDLQRFLEHSMSDPAYCTALVTQTPLNIVSATLPKRLELKNLPSTAAAGSEPLLTAGKQVAGSRELYVAPDGLYLEDLATAAPNKFNATLKVVFDESHLVRAIQPVTMRMQFTTDAKTNDVTACVGSGTLTGGPGMTPKGKCQVLQKPFVYRGADTQYSGAAWSSTKITCPADFPVALSINVVPAGYAGSWSSNFQEGAAGFFTTGQCNMIFLRDDPAHMGAVAMYSDPSFKIDQGLCAVTCCDL